VRHPQDIRADRQTVPEAIGRRRDRRALILPATTSSQRPIIGFTAEPERQAWNDEGREEDRQKALSGASEGDGLALGGLEGLRSAGVSATANLQGVTSRFDWYLDRVVHVERSGTLTVNHDVIGATSDLDSDCFCASFSGSRSWLISIVCRACHGTIVLA
jgi:hypothetical protein